MSAAKEFQEIFFKSGKFVANPNKACLKRPWDHILKKAYGYCPGSSMGLGRCCVYLDAFSEYHFLNAIFLPPTMVVAFIKPRFSTLTSVNIDAKKSV